MKNFIKRIKDAYNYDYAWANEPLFFKVFLMILGLFGGLLMLLYMMVVAVTVPLWIVPYMIYWIRRNKK